MRARIRVFSSCNSYCGNCGKAMSVKGKTLDFMSSLRVDLHHILYYAPRWGWTCTPTPEWLYRQQEHLRIIRATPSSTRP